MSSTQRPKPRRASAAQRAQVLGRRLLVGQPGVEHLLQRPAGFAELVQADHPRAALERVEGAAQRGHLGHVGRAARQRVSAARPLPTTSRASSRKMSQQLVVGLFVVTTAGGDTRAGAGAAASGTAPSGVGFRDGAGFHRRGAGSPRRRASGGADRRRRRRSGLGNRRPVRHAAHGSRFAAHQRRNSPFTSSQTNSFLASAGW
jgi:hypothetical protein